MFPIPTICNFVDFIDNEIDFKLKFKNSQSNNSFLLTFIKEQIFFYSAHTTLSQFSIKIL